MSFLPVATTNFPHPNILEQLPKHKPHRALATVTNIYLRSLEKRMSEPIPESIPTSSDRRSHRPLKKRTLATPSTQQSSQIDALFANPDREIALPSGNNNKARTVAAPPEIVANVQGSSAGAGSGEFHVYKASRRREYERLRIMDEEVEREKADKEFEAKREQAKKRDEDKLSKNQARRAKMKKRKEKAEEGRKNGDGMEVDGDQNGANGAAGGKGGLVKKKLGPAPVALPVEKGDAVEAEAENGNGDGDGQTEEAGGITFHDED